ncbi:MAG: c-type cytochrome [Sphingomonadales bacterium]
MRRVIGISVAIAVSSFMVTADAQERKSIFADPQNLQVLPKDISSGELSKTMRGFALGLGVRCQYCHVGEAGMPLSKFDFPADEKETKATARLMLQMMADINAKTSTVAAKMDRPATEVTCVTCHRGQSRPRLIEAILGEEIEAGGGEAAVKKYKALRKEFYGSHSYDFTERTVSRYADGLSGGNPDASLALHHMNQEFYPESAMVYVYLGDGYRAKGDFDKATGHLRKALEINPKLSFVERWLRAIDEEKKKAKPE